MGMASSSTIGDVAWSWDQEEGEQRAAAYAWDIFGFAQWKVHTCRGLVPTTVQRREQPSEKYPKNCSQF